MDSDWKGGDIHKKMAALMSEDLVIEKSQYNAGQSYKFRGIDDTYLAVKPLLAKHGVFCTPEVLSVDRSEYTTQKGTVMNRIILTVRHRFWASDGSSVDVTTVGEANDAGDKSSYKAMSGAFKYALWEALCIPTDEPKDAEGDNPEPKAPKAHKPRPVAHAPDPVKEAFPGAVKVSGGQRGGGYEFEGRPLQMKIRGEWVNIEDMDDDNLEWWSDKIQSDFKDGKVNKKYAARNKAQLQAMQQELALRRGAGTEAEAPQGEPEVNLEDIPF